MDEELFNVLSSKEERWNKRLELSRKNNMTLVSISLCVPLKYRTDSKYKKIFFDFCDIYEKYCNEKGGNLIKTEGLDGFDGPCVFYLSEKDAKEIKKISVAFEEMEKPFRIMDIDIMDRDQTPIGREELGLPARKCFICNNDSAVCVKSKTHSKAELDSKIKEYFAAAESICKKYK